MQINHNNGLSYYCFGSFPEIVVHGIFTRAGGVSPEPWASLNQGGTVGDARANVVENRRRVFEVMQREVETIFDVWQVHGAKVVRGVGPRPLEQPHQKADAIITNDPKITLFMRFADCVPVLLVDPVQRGVGIVHAGWRGTVQKIVVETVQAMQAEFGSQPGDIVAGIGPSIGADHYEVGPEVVAAVGQSFGEAKNALFRRENGTVFLDLWEANRLALMEAGVEKIEVAQICTACHTEDWYSHRAEQGRTGRFGALLALK